MNKKDVFKNLNLHAVEESSDMPKYMQIVNVILSDVENGIFKPGELIPSLNETCNDFYLSRDTVEKAYNKLKEMGVIYSVRGKGFFVARSAMDDKKQILIITDYFHSQSKEVFDYLKTRIEDSINAEVFFQVGNPDSLKNSLQRHVRVYDYYIVISNCVVHSPAMTAAISLIPEKRLIFLQRTKIQSKKALASICYDESIFKSHYSLFRDIISNYNRIFFGQPGNTFFPELYEGILNYLLDNKIELLSIEKIRDRDIKKNDLFITGNDEELFSILEMGTSKDLVPGRDIGVVSLNNSPLCNYVGGGITMIYPDYEQIAMGINSVLQGHIRDVIMVKYNIAQRLPVG